MLTIRLRHHDSSTPHTGAPAHHRGPPPQRHCFTCNTRPSPRRHRRRHIHQHKEHPHALTAAVPVAPGHRTSVTPRSRLHSELVSHPAALTRGRHQTSRHEVAQLRACLLSGHTKMLPIFPVAPGTPMTHVNQCFLLTPIQTGRRLQSETAKPVQVPIRNQRSIRETHRERHPM